MIGFLNAQDTISNHYTVAADISPYSFKGYSFKAGIIPKNLPKTEFALELFSMEIPELVINLNEQNADQGWSEKVNQGLALYYDRKLNSKRSSFWVGAGIVYLNHSATKTNTQYDYQQLEYLARLNYKWFPFKKSNFYVNPYCAIAARHKVAGNNCDYQLTHFLLIPSVYLSWEI